MPENPSVVTTSVALIVEGSMASVEINRFLGFNSQKLSIFLVNSLPEHWVFANTFFENIFIFELHHPTFDYLVLRYLRLLLLVTIQHTIAVRISVLTQCINHMGTLKTMRLTFVIMLGGNNLVNSIQLSFLLPLLITVSLSGCLHDGKGDRNDEMITYEPGPYEVLAYEDVVYASGLAHTKSSTEPSAIHLCWTSIVRTQTQQTDRS